MIDIIVLLLIIFLGGLLHPLVAFFLVLIFVGPSFYAMLKGAPFVPTPQKRVNKMIELAKIKPDEIIYDLGCGDGRFLVAAVEAGAGKAIGYEMSPLTYLYAKIRTLKYPAIKVKYANFWKADVSNADVVFCFLMTDTMKTFKHLIWPQLKPGTRVVSHAFSLPGVKPDKEGEGIKVYVKS